MNVLTTIGDEDTTIQYTDRPTVKVVIKQDDKLLLFNKAWLPGGWIEPGEWDQDAITRELQEELGVTVKDARKIGIADQHRTLFEKKYLIKGYTAMLEAVDGSTDPQDEVISEALPGLKVSLTVFA